ncbi:hypothetical protein V8G54_023569, partial [Vigna mungo]
INLFEPEFLIFDVIWISKTIFSCKLRKLSRILLLKIASKFMLFLVAFIYCKCMNSLIFGLPSLDQCLIVLLSFLFQPHTSYELVASDLDLTFEQCKYLYLSLLFSLHLLTDMQLLILLLFDQILLLTTQNL